MLDDTLVVWGGEFGRTPFGQGDPGIADRLPLASVPQHHRNRRRIRPWE
jgi:hypothetical protein